MFNSLHYVLFVLFLHEVCVENKFLFVKNARDSGTSSDIFFWFTVITNASSFLDTESNLKNHTEYIKTMNNYDHMYDSENR